MSDQSLKIVFVTNNYTPYAGGVVSSISAFIQELRKQGHIVFIITLDFLGSQQVDPDYVFRITCPIKFYYKNNPIAVPWHMQYQVQELIKTLNPDIIHSHHPWLLGRAAITSARKASIPLVFTYHTLYEHYAHYIPLPYVLTKLIINHLVYKYCQQADGIIAPGSAVLQYLERHAISTPTLLLPSPLTHDFLQNIVVCSSDQHDWHKKCRLLSVSRLNKEKNIEALLDLFADLERDCPGKFSLTFVGYGAHQEALMKYGYNNLCLSSENLIFLGKKSRQELSELYANYDLFVFSSLSDTQGLVLAEAMSSGLPIVALDGPGQRDIVIQGVNGFLASSRHEMKKILQEIIKDKILYQQMRRSAYETAQRYRPEVLTQLLVKFYRQFIEKNKHHITMK